MAGRGTEIKLERVKDGGGLAIIGTERHDSRRVDRQLRVDQEDKEIQVHHNCFS